MERLMWERIMYLQDERHFLERFALDLENRVKELEEKVNYLEREKAEMEGEIYRLRQENQELSSCTSVKEKG